MPISDSDSFDNTSDPSSDSSSAASLTPASASASAASLASAASSADPVPADSSTGLSLHLSQELPPHFAALEEGAREPGEPEGSLPRLLRLTVLVYVIQLLGSPDPESLKAALVESQYFDYFQAATLLDDAIQRKLVDRFIQKNERVRTSTGDPVARISVAPLGLSILEAYVEQIPPAVKEYLSGVLGGSELSAYKHSLNVSASSDRGQTVTFEANAPERLSLVYEFASPEAAERFSQVCASRPTYVYHAIRQVIEQISQKPNMG